MLSENNVPTLSSCLLLHDCMMTLLPPASGLQSWQEKEEQKQEDRMRIRKANISQKSLADFWLFFIGAELPNYLYMERWHMAPLERITFLLVKKRERAMTGPPAVSTIGDYIADFFVKIQRATLWASKDKVQLSLDSWIKVLELVNEELVFCRLSLTG